MALWKFDVHIVSLNRTVAVSRRCIRFVVWNFDTKQVEILEITQRTVQTAMEQLINSEEWGDPLGYSITVNRKGEGLETEYSVVPSPAQATPTPILQAYKEKPINLEALFPILLRKQTVYRQAVRMTTSQTPKIAF